jgi:hypothetical protein
MPRILVFLASAVLAGALAGPASAAWTGATDLAPANPAGKPVGPPSIALGVDGTGFAAFQRYDGANLRAAVATRLPGAGFGSTRDLSPAGKDAFSPAVAVDRQGNATLAWLQGPDFTIQARFRPAGGDWTEPVTVSAPGVTTAPAVAVGDNAAAVLVWGRATGGQVRRVEAAVRMAGDGAFGAPLPVSPDAGFGLCQAPHVAMDAAGDVAAIWTRRTSLGGDYRVETAVKPAAAAAFQPADTRSAQTGNAGCNTDIRMTPGGRATAIWDQRDAADAKFYVAVADRSAPFTAPWSAQTKISTLTVDSTEPVVALDDAGNAGATWLAGGQIVSAFRGAGAFSAPPAPLSGATTLRGEAVAASAGGDMLAAYVGTSNGSDAIFSARRVLGTPFGNVLPVTVTSPGGRLDSPQVALDDQGNAFAVWQQTVGGATTAQVSGFDPVAPAITAAGVPASGIAGTPVSMAAAATDRMSAPELRFDFGDGSSAAGGAVAHIYARPGDYTVTVSATDASGNASSVARPIHIAPAPIAGNTGPNRVLAAAAASWDRLRNGRTRMKTFVVNELVGPEVVKLACKGKGCRRGVNKTVRKHGKTVSFTKQVKGMTLRPGAALTVTITRPGFVSRVISYTMIHKRDPKKLTRCQAPGAKRPGSC